MVRMNEGEKLAYLVGIVEGEGTILINKKLRRGKEAKAKSIGYSLRMIVVNTDSRLIDWLVDNFRGNSCVSVKGGRRRDIYTWYLHGYHVYRLLKQMEKFWVFKKEQAEVAMKFWEQTQRNGNFGRGRKPLWKLKRQEEYFQQLKSLHL